MRSFSGASNRPRRAALEHRGNLTRTTQRRLPLPRRKLRSLDVIQDIVAEPEAVQIEYQELLAQLFARLRQRAPACLLPSIEAWEQLPDGRIAMIQDLL